jgi:hypothetical protein
MIISTLPLCKNYRTVYPIGYLTLYGLTECTINQSINQKKKSGEQKYFTHNQNRMPQ